MQPRYGEARQPLSGRYALYHFGTSGAAVAAATAVTHPFDVIKVRLQMQLAGQRGNLVGMGTIFTQMVEREGTRSLYLGLAPALARAVVYGGLRFGLYEPCKHVCSYAFGSTNFAFKFASGVIAGGLATALTNPMEVLKVRLQMSKSSTSTIREMRKVIAHEGFKALWKGVGPAMTRAGCLTASQMATYDEAKQLELHSWNSWYSCDRTCRHDQNTVNAATGVQRSQSIQERIPLCFPGFGAGTSCEECFDQHRHRGLRPRPSEEMKRRATSFKWGLAAASRMRPEDSDSSTQRSLSPDEGEGSTSRSQRRSAPAKAASVYSGG